MKFSKLFPNFPKSETYNATKEAIKSFTELAKKMPEFEVDLTSDNETLVAESADDFSMHIRHDLDANLELVYQGVITTYCPQVEVKTRFNSDLIECVKDLSTLYKKERTTIAAHLASQR